MSEDTQTLGGLKSGSSEGFSVIYSNLFRHRLTFSDFSITFSLISDLPGIGTRPVIDDKVNVIMPLPQFKALTEAMSMLLAEFENKFGPIVVAGAPPSPVEAQNLIEHLAKVGHH